MDSVSNFNHFQDQCMRVLFKYHIDLGNREESTSQINIHTSEMKQKMFRTYLTLTNQMSNLEIRYMFKMRNAREQSNAR